MGQKPNVFMPPKKTSQEKLLKKREAGWDDRTHQQKLPEYNPLYDKHLRQFFENPKVQSYFLANGFIDKEGHVIDLEKNKAKMLIIEQEFKRAEREEYLLLKEEERRRKLAKEGKVDPSLGRSFSNESSSPKKKKKKKLSKKGKLGNTSGSHELNSTENSMEGGQNSFGYDDDYGSDKTEEQNEDKKEYDQEKDEFHGDDYTTKESEEHGQSAENSAYEKKEEEERERAISSQNKEGSEQEREIEREQTSTDEGYKEQSTQDQDEKEREKKDVDETKMTTNENN